MTFPYNENFPAQHCKLFDAFQVSAAVSFELWSPILQIGFWGMRHFASTVRMPEASMNENHLSPRGKYQVWFAWKILSMQPKAVPQMMRKLPDGDFWKSVLALWCAGI